ncbi:MAG: hypothetical protein CVV24_10085 [Ignavibacteriae bacterium HGW-Ignavibacteriae-3]|nr:MAG: hypothetical protein CVV24_10085 [Ignavibacteriae bacterium HGW-Ignavibacteriae-3]
MSLKYYLLILLYPAINCTSAQIIVQSGQIGLFNSANSFSINPGGNIYVSDSGTNEIIKMDTLGNVLRTIGGYGWSESSFDNPADVYASTLNVYVSDKNNNRIQFLDKDLNFISQFSSGNIKDESSAFRYPLGSAVSTQGDLYILDSDNNRILKFNSRGDFQAAVGSFDAGAFALNSPKQFAITSSKILVIDSKKLIVFDQFGNGIRKINLDFNPDNINITFRNICITDKSRIIYFNETDMDSGNLSPITFTPNLENEIIDALIFNSKLYILTKESILIYNIIRQN